MSGDEAPCTLDPLENGGPNLEWISGNERSPQPCTWGSLNPVCFASYFHFTGDMAKACNTPSCSHSCMSLDYQVCVQRGFSRGGVMVISLSPTDARDPGRIERFYSTPSASFLLLRYLLHRFPNIARTGIGVSLPRFDYLIGPPSR